MQIYITKSNLVIDLNEVAFLGTLTDHLPENVGTSVILKNGKRIQIPDVDGLEIIDFLKSHQGIASA